MNLNQASLSRLARVVVGAIAVLVLFIGGMQWLRPREQLRKTNVPLGLPVAADASSRFRMSRFLLDRVHRDPEDFVAQNMLTAHLLRNLRETGNADFLERARQAARASLASVPAERNFGGLNNLARTEIAAHEFANAREHALRLTKLDPNTLSSYSVLFDAVLELGDYAAADGAVQQMRKLGNDTTETEIRLGRILFLQGDSDGARRHMFRALAFARNTTPPEPEPTAWCHWQSGELEFYEGHYREAERHYRAALETFPGYVQGLASLGRARAAQGDIPGAIKLYEEAIGRFPDPVFVGALGDLYRLSRREQDAEAQYALVEHIGHLSALNGARYNRPIAVFYADHDLHPDRAYENAVREYAQRKDIYGADALAWAACKAGKLSEAERASREALRLGTRDPRLLYHAGMIARAAGDRETARRYLRRALKLSPMFDPLQAGVARNALDE